MENNFMIRLLSAVLLISIIAFGSIIYLYKKSLDEKNKDAIFLNKKKAETNFFYTAYQFFSQFFFTKKIVRRIGKQYEILLPGDIKKISEKTMELVFMMWGISGIGVIWVVLTRPELYTILIMVFMIYVIEDQIVYYVVNREDIRILKEFEKYLNDMQHNYSKHGMVDEAIYESLETASQTMILHGTKIYEILSSDDIDESVARYNDTVPNRFLKTFVALCAMVIKFGDKEVDERSLFLTNVKKLKQDIQIELLKKERIKYAFSFLIAIEVVPIFSLRMIENWGISNVPELKEYYEGAYSIIFSVGIFILSVILYNVIMNLKTDKFLEKKDYFILSFILKNKILSKIFDDYINKNYSRYLRLRETIKKSGESITVKQLLLKRILFGMAALAICTGISFQIHSVNKWNYIYQVDNLVNISSSASKEQVKSIQDSVTKYTGIYKNKEATIEEVKNDLIAEGIIKNKEILTITSEEIIQRIQAYQHEYYKWYELLIGIAISILAFCYPYIVILYQKKIMEMSMEDELIQFQSIILMLMHINRTNIEMILEWMEDFAVIFKTSISECRNNFESGDLAALEELKRKETFEPFQRLVENLITSDKIGIEKAFDEIAVERSNYQDKRKQENEISIKQKAAYGMFLSHVPLMTIIVLYLLIPFVVESLSQFVSYSNQISLIK